MAIRKKHSEDKVKSGINFILSFPVRFNISSTDSFRQKLLEYCNKSKISTTDLSKKLLFSFFDVSNVNELMQNREIKKAVLRLNDTIKDEMGLTNREFSVWYRQAFDECSNE